jgi:hypothetical protein
MSVINTYLTRGCSIGERREYLNMGQVIIIEGDAGQYGRNSNDWKHKSNSFK